MSDYYDKPGIVGRAWFKPLAALWFGALAALGMWFMPPDVHASLVRATGLANVHPLFALPVSREGVLALCGAAFLVGALLGVLIAWRIARASAPRAFAPGFEMHGESVWEDEREEAAFEEPRRRRVFSAREDIGEEGIAISAPTHDEEGDYEDEYSLADIPPASPEEDFEVVYAEMDEDYVAADYEPEEVVSAEEPVVEEAFEEEEPADTPAFVEEAEYEEVELAEAETEIAVEPEPEWHSEPAGESEAQTQPEPDYESEYIEAEEFAESEDEPFEESEALGDMSLEALLGRLEGALEQHKKMVAGSEEAALEPAPQPVPLVREPAPTADEVSAEELAEASDDDPVIAFLRREASRRMPPPPTSEMDDEPAQDEPRQQSQTDAQAALRSALERLGQVNRRD